MTENEEAVIAFTVGSLWYCFKCGRYYPDADPVTADNTMDCYTYHCDDCGKLIKERQV